ncbi:DUF4034 domain-containing protein [Asanoa siamensis]|uniref:DUF4034 domain-containing protein n=1 Tax=Asanoa siamensis TaxID=926357 RepID=A0ABQ4CQ38_9ACTN|nr:DUF4034 domain-containing protein [Asanoa siamensis]GIF73423.1 hypothetical protein Asi02nite_29410 [Asanoa siamensis]
MAPIPCDPHPAEDDAALRRAHDTLAYGGDWRMARDLLASAAGDDDRRSRYVGVFAESALGPTAPGRPVEDATWVDAWARAEPDNADALLVRGRSLITRAWEVRGGGWASSVSKKQWAEFHRLLALAVPVYERAVALAPADPLPWAHRILLGTAQKAKHDEMERCWAELVARDPGHVEGHSLKLMYLCRKWHGSHQKMFAFARTAAAAAPDGSPLLVLPLIAGAEWASYRTTAQKSLLSTVLVRRYWRRNPQVQAEIDAALHRWFTRPTRRDGWYVQLNYLSYALYKAQRHADNRAVIAAIGPYISGLPWGWAGEKSALDAFTKAHTAAYQQA